MSKAKILIVSIVSIVISLSGECQTIADSTTKSCCLRKTYINEVLNKLENDYLKQLSSYRIIDYPNSVRLTIDFLNNDFETNVFSQFDFIKSTNFGIVSNEVTRHLGIIEIGMKSNIELEKVRNIIESTGRTNFKLKVLTKFIIISKKNNLLIVFSETPYEGLISSFFEQVMKL